MPQSRPIVFGLACLTAALLASGCNRSVSALDPGAPPAPLTSAPLDPVQSQSLDPVTGQPMVQPNGATGDQMASLDPNAPGQPGASGAPPVAGPEISREAMTGTWTVATDNPDCRIILAFTKWSGGYRAATRRCEAPELAGVTAWDVRGSQVILVDGTGNTVATLYSAGPELYDGRTSGGRAIRFSR